MMKIEFSLDDQIAWAKKRLSLCECDELMRVGIPRYKSLVELLEELKERRKP